MAANDVLLSELLNAANSGDTDIGQRGFQRLTLAALADVKKKVDDMPSLDKRLTRLEWLMGGIVTVLSVAAFAIINGVISGRIVITIVP